MDSTIFTPKDLAKRWGLTLGTLEQWRWRGKGPKFFKVGNKVKYRSKDIDSFEEQRIRQNTVYKNFGG